jgi:hypothetical protein
VDEFKGGEQYPISHGNWDHRYKVSISGEKIRFTLNTTTSITDLDSEKSPVPGQWHHLATVYDGEDMELWIDGTMDAFTSCSGLIKTTSYDLAFGQHLPGENGNNFRGSLDAVSFFDFALSEAQIMNHMENAINITVLPAVIEHNKNISVFPNPVSGDILKIMCVGPPEGEITVALYDVSGRQITTKNGYKVSAGDPELSIHVGELESGLYLLSVTYIEKTENQLFIIAR